MSTGSYSFDYTYDGVGSMEMTAVVHATMNGAEGIQERLKIKLRDNGDGDKGYHRRNPLQRLC